MLKIRPFPACAGAILIIVFSLTVALMFAAKSATRDGAERGSNHVRVYLPTGEVREFEFEAIRAYDQGGMILQVQIKDGVKYETSLQFESWEKE